MTLYLDSSALVKRYIAEPGSIETRTIIAEAPLVGTAVITRVEVDATFGRAIRMGQLEQAAAEIILDRFHHEWPLLLRLPITEALAVRAGQLARLEGLRAYDAVQLAAALTWQDLLGQPVTMATFDRRLWAAAARTGLIPFPALLP